jgi:iron(III) transport system permease protein
MTLWRVTIGLMLLGVAVLPVAMPFLELLGESGGWQAWEEWQRLLSLARNTLVLIAGTLVVVLPAGVVGAVLLYRTDLPLRRELRLLTLLTLFIPLPLFTSAWQIVLGSGGWLPTQFWGTPLPGDPDVSTSGMAWKPWGHGPGGAIWVHAVAGLPWVIVLVGQGLRWVERELEEDALTIAGPWRVLWMVSLPRCRAAIFAAGLWVALMTMTEITVTDMMQVRTFAEEVYTQFVGSRDQLPRAVAVSLPAVALTAALVVWASQRWERTLPPRQTLEAPPRLIELGKARVPCLIVVLAVVGVLAGVPLESLLWKTGATVNPDGWSAQVFVRHLANTVRVRGLLVVESFFLAAGSGALTAGLALVVCWLAVGARWFRLGALGLMAVLWALPGPILGIGLKDTIAWVVDVVPVYPLAVALYYGPSPVPAVWAHMVRFFPCAVAVLWPVLRLFPGELRDAARVDGARPRQELRHLVLPLAWPACLRAGFAVMVLSLGELSAGKLVGTPGSRTFAQEVFDQMHYGVTNDLAALCLLLLAVVVLGGVCLAVAGWLGRRSSGEVAIFDS